MLADYVGEPVTIRYDPRDVTEIRVFHEGGFLCRAVSTELAEHAISLKEITAARNARRRELGHRLADRASVVDRLLAVHRPAADPIPVADEPPASVRPQLRRYREE